MDIITFILIIVFVFALAIVYKLGHKNGRFKQDKKWQEDLPNHRKDAVLRSRAVLSGHFSEQLAPYLPDFKYAPNECRFLGKPIDLLVFKGMDKKEIDEVVFVEIKSGNAKLSPIERNLKKAIQEKKIRWEEYRIPKNLTSKDGIEDKIAEVIDPAIKAAKKFFCMLCGRKINHKRQCLPCNIKKKGKLK